MSTRDTIGAVLLCVLTFALSFLAACNQSLDEAAPPAAPEPRMVGGCEIWRVSEDLTYDLHMAICRDVDGRPTAVSLVRQ